MKILEAQREKVHQDKINVEFTLQQREQKVLSFEYNHRKPEADVKHRMEVIKLGQTKLSSESNRHFYNNCQLHQ